MVALPTVETVARLLRNAETRPATLDALEAHGPVEQAVTLAAAAALGELLAADAEQELGVEQFDRVGLLLGRLCAEAEAWGDQGSVKVYGAAFADGRLAAAWGSETNVVGRALRKPVDELTVSDVYSIACMFTCEAAASNKYFEEMLTAATTSQTEWFSLWSKVHPIST
eukprot:COSAG02_NODE_1670_length_11394_cov_4.791855_2_plen_169_part_00